MKIELSNLGTINQNLVTLKGSDNRNYLNIYFSYQTPVSFNGTTTNNHEYNDFTRVNDWSTTTGKLLTKCEPDKKKRISGELFEQKLSEALSAFE